MVSSGGILQAIYKLRAFPIFFALSLFPFVSVCAQPLLGLASIFIEWMDGLSAC